jgi:hypothetical protein
VYSGIHQLTPVPSPVRAPGPARTGERPRGPCAHERPAKPKPSCLPYRPRFRTASSLPLSECEGSPSRSLGCGSRFAPFAPHFFRRTLAMTTSSATPPLRALRHARQKKEIHHVGHAGDCAEKEYLRSLRDRPSALRLCRPSEIFLFPLAARYASVSAPKGWLRRRMRQMVNDCPAKGDAPILMASGNHQQRMKLFSRAKCETKRYNRNEPSRDKEKRR